MSTPQSDPFAEASITNPNISGRADAFTPNADADDPFATSSDYRGGDFTPAVPLENLQDRLVVMIPRKFDPEAPNSLKPGETREQYTVDLYVLSGGRLSYFYNVKANPERNTPAETKEMIIDDVSPQTPFEIKGYWVPQGGIVGKLKQAHKEGRPYLGVPAMMATKADRERGKTSAQVRAEVAAWISRGRQGARPMY